MAERPSSSNVSTFTRSSRHSRRYVIASALGLAATGLLAACGASTGATTVPRTSTAPSRTTGPTSSVASSPASATGSTTPTATTAAMVAATSAAAVPATSAAPRPGTVELLFWANGTKGDPSYAAWVQRIGDFTQAHPGFVARMDAPADLDNKLAASVAGGSPPNVAVQNRVYLPAGAAKGLMLDIAAYANQAGIKGADEQPWCWPQVFLKGKLFGLPYSTDSRMVYVNVSHLQQAGVSTTPPKTLEDFTQIGQHLDVKSGTGYDRLGFYPWNDNWSPYGWGWLFGGDFYDATNNVATLTDPKVVAAFDWAGGVARQLGYQAVQDFITAHKSAGNLFTAQLQSTYINSTSFLITVNAAGPSLNWTVWPPPPPSAVAHMSTWSGGFCDVLPAGVKEPDQSFALANALTDATMQRIQMQTGRLPTLTAVAADPYWQTVDPRIKAFVDLLPYSHSYPVTPQVNILTSTLADAFNAVLKGQQTAAEALQQANQLVNEAIKENRV